MLVRGNVEQRRAPSPAHFRREFSDAGRPVLLKHAIADWRAVGRWTFAWFRESHGDLSVPVQRWMASSFAHVEFERMKLSQYLDRIHDSVADGTQLHLAGHCMLRDAATLWDDISVPPYVGRLGDDQPFVFFSGKGTRTPLHHDLCHNFYAQVSGRKRFLLFSPDQRHLLHAPPRWQRSAWTSPVDVDAPDYLVHPLARHARPLEVVLKPGDALFLPGGYWHAVRSLDDSIAVAFFWEHGLRQRATRALLRAIGRPTT